MNSIPLLRDPARFNAEVIREHDPPILFIHDFLSPEECDILIAKSQKVGFFKSEVVLDGKRELSSIRTSETGNKFNPKRVVKFLYKRLEKMTNRKSGNLEFQFTRYHKDQFYKTHHDSDSNFVKTNGYKRLFTFFVYLNDMDQTDGVNGHTAFPHIQVTSEPIKGKAAFWCNFNDDGTECHNSGHMGSPIISSEIKYGLNIWIKD